MAYDEGIAELMRSDFDEPMAEQRMFGGLAFMREGHMVCGTFRDGGLYRVGAEREADALSRAGVRPMEMGGRTMKNFVVADAEAMADDDLRRDLLAMALRFVDTLPPK